MCVHVCVEVSSTAYSCISGRQVCYCNISCLLLCLPVPGDEMGGGGGEVVELGHKTGDVHLAAAGTHITPQGEGPANPTPFSPTAKQTTMERAKLPKSPKR